MDRCLLMISMAIRKKIFLIARLFALCCCIFLLTGCEAQVEGAAQILVNLQKTYTVIVGLIVSIAYLAGAAFFMKGIFAFKVYAEQRTMMSSQLSIKIPISYVAAGVGLLWLPTVISITTNSVFMTPDVNIIGYNMGITPADKIRNAVYATIQVMGLIAVLRSFFLATVHQPIGGGGQGGMGKAVLHFAGGLAALNIDKLVNILHDIFAG